MLLSMVPPLLKLKKKKKKSICDEGQALFCTQVGHTGIPSLEQSQCARLKFGREESSSHQLFFKHFPTFLKDKQE